MDEFFKNDEEYRKANNISPSIFAKEQVSTLKSNNNKLEVEVVKTEKGIKLIITWE
jgi:hypothetical protein